jgi:DNA-binding CsgD family transcriptional regulator
MANDSRWYRVVELIEDLCRQRDSSALVSRLFEEMDRLVPAEQGVAFFEMRRGLPHCLRWPDYSEALVPAFNEHFNHCCPAEYDWNRHQLGPVSWAEYVDTEYDCDFNVPLAIGHSLGFGFYDHVKRREMILCFHRARHDSGFSDDDVAIVERIRPLVERLFRLMRSAEASESELFERLTFPASTARLSPREAEIAKLLCTRLTLNRIAERLQVSSRTVESHVLHIYQKLGVSGRQELISYLNPSRQHVNVTE